MHVTHNFNLHTNLGGYSMGRIDRNGFGQTLISLTPKVESEPWTELQNDLGRLTLKDSSLAGCFSASGIVAREKAVSKCFTSIPNCRP